MSSASWCQQILPFLDFRILHPGITITLILSLFKLDVQNMFTIIIFCNNILYISYTLLKINVHYLYLVNYPFKNVHWSRTFLSLSLCVTSLWKPPLGIFILRVCCFAVKPLNKILSNQFQSDVITFAVAYTISFIMKTWEGSAEVSSKAW